MDQAQRGPCAMTESQIFSHPTRPNLVNKYFIVSGPFGSYDNYSYFRNTIEPPGALVSNNFF